MRSDWGKLPIYDHEKNPSIFLIHDRRKEISLCAASVHNNIVTKNDDWNVHPLVS